MAMIDVLHAIQYLHEVGLVHRDLKVQFIYTYFWCDSLCMQSMCMFCAPPRAPARALSISARASHPARFVAAEQDLSAHADISPRRESHSRLRLNRAISAAGPGLLLAVDEARHCCNHLRNFCCNSARGGRAGACTFCYVQGIDSIA